MSDSETPRVWVGCLACYNGGNLIGQWFDAAAAPAEMDEFNTALQIRVQSVQGEGWAAEHLTDAHEELWVFDHENFHGLIGECSPMEAQAVAETLEESGNPAAYAAFASHEGGVEYGTVERFEEAFCGEWDTEAGYAQELAEELTPNGRDLFSTWPTNCIDWEHAWRELDYGGDNYAVDIPGGGVWIFRNI